MKKESVNKFDLEAAFKALEEIEIPVVKGIKPNRENLQEKFTKKSTTEVLVEDYFDVNDQGDLEAAQEEREAEIAKAKLARIEKIVDLDAESEEDLLPSYVGKFIIQCPQCMTLFYKNQEDIEKSEENPEVVNINEVCQHCGNTSGYTLIGKVDNVGEEEAENYDVEDFDENELNLDFDAEESVEEESAEEEPVEDETAEEGNEEELELEPVEETEEDSEEEEVKESLTLNEEVEDEEVVEDEISEEEVEEILTSVDEVKEVAEEAAEAVLEASEEETLEDIKEVTDEVVEDHFEVSEEEVKEEPAEETEEVAVEDEIVEDEAEEKVEESLTEAVDKDLDDKLKAHNEYIEYLKEMIEKEEKSLANAKNDFVKKSIQSRIDSLKADLEAALPEVLKDEVETELPTAEEVELEATENTEEKEETKESLTEDTAVKPRVRHQSRREIFSRELAAHPAFEGISTRDLERFIIDLYLEDDPTAELDVEQVVEYVENLGWGKIILDNIDNLSEGQVRHFAQKDPVFVSTVKEFLGDWLIPNKTYSVGALVSELLVFLGKKPADREEAKDFEFDSNDASYKEFKDELADAYYEAKELVPVGEALVGDVNINLDARGQSVGLLKGQGGEVHNDMTEEIEELDEFIGPAVASIAGSAAAASVANSAASAVSSLVSEDVEELKEAGDLDTLLDSEEFKKPISEAEVENILAKYESLEEDVEPGIESELAIQDIVDTWESVEEIDEESLDKLTENYLTEVYSNVKTFKTVDCALENNKLVIEGKITFNSGKTKNTKFIYEAKKENDKIVLEGLNADFATEKAFILNCNLDTANRLVVESLNYKYTINNTLVEGLLR